MGNASLGTVVEMSIRGIFLISAQILEVSHHSQTGSQEEADPTMVGEEEEDSTRVKVINNIITKEAVLEVLLETGIDLQL